MKHPTTMTDDQTLYMSKPCWACRIDLPFGCRCDHGHEMKYEGQVSGGSVDGGWAENVYRCAVCGLETYK